MSDLEWGTRVPGERIVPVFRGVDGVRVPAEKLQDELNNYASDVRRGVVTPRVSFTAYVERYCGWTLEGQ